MIRKKCCVVAGLSLVISVMAAGCSNVVKNPMQYIMNEDETRQADKTKESESSDDNEQKETSEEQTTKEVCILGTDKRTDYSSKAMVLIAQEINQKLEDDSVKGVILLQDKNYIEDMSYFFSLTVKDDKPLIIIPCDYEENEPVEYVNQAKAYIADSKADVVLPENVILNHNTSVYYDISGVKDLPDVTIIYDYAGSTGDDYIRAINKCDGVVIVSFSDTAEVSYAYDEYLSDKNIIPTVIACEIADTGSIEEKEYNSDVSYTNISPSKARLLLMLSLNSKENQEQRNKAFQQN